MTATAHQFGVARVAIILLWPLACRGAAPRGAVREPTSPPAVRHDEHIFAGGVAPPATAVRNPYRGDQASARQGEQLFSAMNCDGCHGSGALGWVGPSLADGRWRFGGGDGAIFESIYFGRPHGMPAYGGLLLSADAVWKLVTYLQSLPPPADVPTEAWK
jgi:mono/diheme cytochrome c family protein